MPRTMLRGAVLTTVIVLQACASLGEQDKGLDLTIDAPLAEDFSPVAHTKLSGLAEYKYSNSSHKAEWINCKLAAPKASILVVHSDRAGYDPQKFCAAWVAQTFLAQGFDVIALNRPGYGASTGTVDFAGEQSMAAMQAAMQDAVEQGKSAKPVSGAWAYSTGVAAATGFARKQGNLQFLLLGGGVYDYEESLEKTQDAYLKKDLEKIKATGGTKAIEARSIAFDVSGLPKTIMVYHGKLDTSVSPQQAQTFSDSLKSSEYAVTMQVVDGVGHDIPWATHRKILSVLAHSVLNGN